MTIKTAIQSALARTSRVLGALADGDDASYLDGEAPLATIASHTKQLDYLRRHGDHEGMRILEVGSREVTGPSLCRQVLTKADYVGFDYYPGANVDVVGDAHRLSSYFEADEKFDVIYSTACFEHFAMPWIVAVEIAKLLKVDGLVVIETPFSFSSHERPWHFFHFTDMGLRVLFSPALGIECIESGFSNPIVGRFSTLADAYLRNRPVTGLYCHADFLGRKVREVETFDWASVNFDALVDGTKYPEPAAESTE